ncbi:hypothetical protein N9A86_05360 [Akkermansiaceae bacterium]|nr:hypothetical protein [Akkermansiaceae bacterium]MDB4544427.1 hypothetical protein [Akkermansiaceae bacterium]
MQNPYQSPGSKDHSEDSSPFVAKPAQVTVFGILHVVLSLIGFGGIIMQKLVSQNPKATILDTFQHDKDTPAQFTPEALEALNTALSLNVYFEVFTAILATMLLTSGLAMLLNARWGISLSNKYSVVSIVTKIVTIILLLTIAMPAYQSFCDGISGADEDLVTTVCLLLKFSSIGGAALMMIYPILAMILLTRQKVTDYQQSL